MIKEKREAVERDFIVSTAVHKVEILHDDGIYRHLKCTNNGSSIHRFDIVTYPGYLVYSGDMGTYVFSRLDDMFHFFGKEGISPDYWHQKLESVDRNSGSKEFSYEKFEENVKYDFEHNWDLPFFEKLKIWGEIYEEIFDDPVKTEEEAYKRLHNFTASDGSEFSDIGDFDFTEYTYRFIWCLYAIVWAIGQYEEMKDVSN